jgi:Tfp pilus assembly protein PilF
MSLLEQALKKAERAKLNGAQEGALEGERAPGSRANPLTLAELDAGPADAALSLAPLTGPPPPGFSAVTPDLAGPAMQQTDERAAPMAGLGEEPAPDAAPRGPARAASEPAADKSAPAPDGNRLPILIGVLALIVAGFGYRYWQALNGPGAGANLPMVPMPPPGAASPPSLPIPAPAPAPAPSAPAGEEVFAPPTEPATPYPAPSPAPITAPPAPMQMAPPPTSTTAQLSAPPVPGAGEPQRASHRSNAGPSASPPTFEAEPGAAPASANIRVTHGTAEPHINPALQGAYQAFTAGDDAGARRQYETVLRQEPNNRDALLGLAAVAQRADALQQAAALYQRLLELDPQDADALAGLSSVRQGDPGRDELRLKAELRQAPDSGALLFALGNLYARQGRWPEAQQSYFRAAGAAPANPDYAFNLAVGLDRLNQGKLALDYYRRALDLAQAAPAAFAPDAARRRIDELSAAAAISRP